MALVDDFSARFPEFSNETVEQYIPILESVWPCYYGGTYDGCEVEIVLNLLAHLIFMETIDGAESIKDVNSQSVASVSESFTARSSSGQNADFFGSSKYGQRYLFLTSKFIGARFV